MALEKREPKTDKELRELAIQYVGGSIFTDRHIPEDEYMSMLQSVFMPLALANEELIDFLQSAEIALLYEHLHKRQERSVNGYPIFFSFNYLTQPELDKFAEHVRKLEEFQNEFREGE